MGLLTMIPSMPALLLNDEKRYLVIADLHIGFESILESNDIHVGKNSTVHEVVADVSRLVSDYDIDSLVLLGDVKAGIHRITRQEWDDVPMFFEKICRITEVMLVPGNHDANIQRLLPDSVIQASPAGLVIGATLLTHGHLMPSDNYLGVDRIVMGHIHPVFFHPDSVLNGQRVWVSARINRDDIFQSGRGTLDILIMPSYNRYFYATHRNQYRRSTSPIVRRIKSIESASIVTLDGSIIGDREMIGSVL